MALALGQARLRLPEKGVRNFTFGKRRFQHHWEFSLIVAGNLLLALVAFLRLDRHCSDGARFQAA